MTEPGGSVRRPWAPQGTEAGRDAVLFPGIAEPVATAWPHAIMGASAAFPVRNQIMSKKTPARRLAPGADRDKLAADLKSKYERGKSIRALADETGRSYGGVHCLLEDAGATFRSRGGAPRRTE